MTSTDGRDRIRRMLEPRAIAIIGASERPGLARNILEAARRIGFRGPLYPVNPKYNEVGGLKCFPSVDALPEEVDVAAVAIPTAAVASAVEACGRKHIAGAVVMSGGFGEGSGAGHREFLRLQQMAHDCNVALLGPNCIGFANVSGRAAVWGGTTLGTARPGGVSLVSQSGSPAIAVAAHRFGVGCRLLVNTGNEAGLDIAALVDLLVDDVETQTIAVYLEELKNPDLFMSAAARAVAAQKPIIVFKGGRSERGRAAAAAHTASLAGDPQVYAAVFEQAGVVQVRDFDEFLETILLFSRSRLPRGNRIGVITGSGGLKVMASDVFEELDLEIPAFSDRVKTELTAALPASVEATNPLDLTAEGLANREIHSRCVAVLAEASDIDLLCIHPLVPHKGLAEAAAEVAGRTSKPLVFVLSNAAQAPAPDVERILEEARIPQVHGTSVGFRAVAHLAGYGKRLRESASRRPSAARRVEAGTMSVVDGILARRGGFSLSEREAKKVLEAFGIPITRELLATSAEEAVRHAEVIGLPVVMKITSPDIAHKTEVGGVLVDVRSADEVRSGYDALAQKAGAALPRARLDGVLVQEYVRGGVETILGATRDERFGPMVLFGLGGIYVEVLKDYSLRRAPISVNDADAMIRSLRSYSILTGVRGSVPADIRCLRDALVQLSELALALGPRLSQIDVNPFVIGPSGGKAVDALISITSEVDSL